MSAVTHQKFRQCLLPWGGAGLGLALGFLATFAVWQWSERTFEHDTQDYFEFRVRQLMTSLEYRLATYQQVLHGARGLFAASASVERHEFKAYVESLHLQQRYPGIQGVGFVELVPKEHKDRHVMQIRRQGHPDYGIFPEEERNIYAPIIYLEPFAGRNLRAFGYDMYSEPLRYQAMQYASEHNTIGMSGKVILVQETDTDVQPGFLLYLPVYQKQSSADSVTEPKAQLLGWVYEAFRIRDFIAGLGDERQSDLHLSIFDGDILTENNLMYTDRAEIITDHILVTTKTLNTGGRTWTLVIHSEPGLRNWLNQDQSLIILISGTTLSLMLGLLIREFIARGQALSLAEASNQELLESEARFRLMADSAPVLIWVTDAAESAIWVNKHWLEFTGRDLAQEIGNGWLDSVFPGHVDLVKKLLSWHFQSRKPFNVEYRLLRYDGEYRWVHNNGAPRFDEAGQFVGFIGSCIDITSHKEMEEELWELATTDGLTGFLNRRHFLVRLQEEFDRIQRTHELNSSLLMLDLDYFKRINDSHGHAAGDAVLKHFADIIRTQQRKIDLVGRLGGEEFAIVLPDTDASEARVFAERLRLSLEAKPLCWHSLLISITVSIGIAQLNHRCQSPDAVLGAADDALYQAKASGRNQVVLARCDSN